MIGGLTSTIRLAPLASVHYIAAGNGRDAIISLRSGCSFDDVKFPEGALTFGEEAEPDPSGVVYSAEVAGQLSPVCTRVSELLGRYVTTPFVCIIELKNGGRKIVGDTNIGCTMRLTAEVSPDFSTTAYNVTIQCRNTHESYFLS
jgi:hypothetical protein